MCVHVDVCGGHPLTTPTHIHPPLPPRGTPRISQNSIALELIKIFQFCLKILNLWRLPHPWVPIAPRRSPWLWSPWSPLLSPWSPPHVPLVPVVPMSSPHRLEGPHIIPNPPDTHPPPPRGWGPQISKNAIRFEVIEIF